MTSALTSVWRQILLAGLASTALLVLTPAQAADKLPVVASFGILGDMVSVVGAQRINVTTLVGANEDAHAFEPKPADAKAILRSRLLFINGLGFEPWAQKLASAAGYQGVTVVVSAGVKPRTLSDEKGHAHHGHDHAGHAHDEADPHAWQNPDNVVLYVRNIAAALSQADPAGRALYQANSAAYVQELQALDAWAKAQFAAIPVAKRKVITSHDAFGYFADHYQIKFFAPQGVSTETEPGAKQVAQLIRQIQREKIRAVFIENMSNPKLLAQLSQDAGVSVGASLYADALSSADQPGASYLKMMRHNVTQLAAGMALN